MTQEPKKERKKRGKYFTGKSAMPSNFRTLIDSYHHLCSKYPREKWEEYSYRKQVCLRYIEWMVNPRNKELRGELVDKVKEWRKHEKGRVGGKRSILEKLARRFFRQRKREKQLKEGVRIKHENINSQMERKVGIYSDEFLALRKTSDWAKWVRSFGKKKKGLFWTVYSPTGEVYHVQGLKEICEEFGLGGSHLGNTSNYPGKFHKGWRAVKRNPDVEKALEDLT